MGKNVYKARRRTIPKHIFLEQSFVSFKKLPIPFRLKTRRNRNFLLRFGTNKKNLKLASAIFYQVFISHQIIALHKL